jgi:hypothetical protein
MDNVQNCDTVVILIYHRHKPTDLIYTLTENSVLRIKKEENIT